MLLSTATRLSISHGKHFPIPEPTRPSLHTTGVVLTLLCALLVAGQTYAAEINKIEIVYEDRTYSVSFDATLYANASVVERIVTDHANLKSLSSRVSTSEVLSAANDDNARLKLILRPCVLFYCKRLTKTSDVRVTRGSVTTINYIADPEHSSFKVANEQLTVTKKSDRTQLNYTATIVPAFRIPPVVGPWLVKRVLRKELIEVGENVEKQASGESL